MQQRPREEQAAVDGAGIEPGEEVRRLEHVRRVHQETAQKRVVDALGRGNPLERVAVAAQHLAADRAVVRVVDRLDPAQHLVIRLPAVERGDGNERVRLHRILRSGEPQTADRDLRRAAVFAHGAAQLDDLARVRRADGAGIVPELALDRAAAVGKDRRHKGLARRRRLERGAAEDVEPLDLVAGMHLADGFSVFQGVSYSQGRRGCYSATSRSDGRRPDR